MTRPPVGRSVVQPNNIQSEMPGDLAPTGSYALAVRSAALIARGLRDLAGDSNWLVRKIFDGTASRGILSPHGQVCALRDDSSDLTFIDLEHSLPAFTLNLRQPPAATAFSADGHRLLVAYSSPQPSLELFNLRSKNSLGSWPILAAGAAPTSIELASSPSSSLIAVSCSGQRPSLSLWSTPQANASLPTSSLRQIETPDWIETQGDETDSAEAGAFAGYGRIAFSPDEKSLAVVAQIAGEWADDLIAVLDVATLRKKAVFEVQGRVTDLAWSADSRAFVYCSAGQAYAVDAVSHESTSLPFGAEKCAWHPHLPVCLFFSSWLRSSAQGRIFLADMDRLRSYDESPAENICDLRWNLDGSKAFAISPDGLAFLYEPDSF